MKKTRHAATAAIMLVLLSATSALAVKGPTPNHPAPKPAPPVWELVHTPQGDVWLCTTRWE